MNVTETKRLRMLSVRASDEEKARVKRLAAAIIKANPYVTEADVLRELIGLVDTGLITDEMRRGLQSDEDGDFELTDSTKAEAKEPHAEECDDLN
jgi:predicted transcriptional regulator